MREHLIYIHREDRSVLPRQLKELGFRNERHAVRRPHTKILQTKLRCPAKLTLRRQHHQDRRVKVRNLVMDPITMYRETKRT